MKKEKTLPMNKSKLSCSALSPFLSRRWRNEILCSKSFLFVSFSCENVQYKMSINTAIKFVDIGHGRTGPIYK